MEVYRFDGDDPSSAEITVGSGAFEPITSLDSELFDETHTDVAFSPITARYVGLRFLDGGDLNHANTQFS